MPVFRIRRQRKAVVKHLDPCIAIRQNGRRLTGGRGRDGIPFDFGVAIRIMTAPIVPRAQFTSPPWKAKLFFMVPLRPDWPAVPTDREEQPAKL
jgi:hypothetical protein